ncbi:MAG: phosphoribosylamine--glycine ligase [Saprospiraceae bacterium]
MRILILGSGGRECTLAWKLAQSPQCDQLWIAPGNAGTRQYGTNVAIHPEDADAVHAFIRKQAVDLVVIGPEAPLVDGLVDALRSHPENADVILVGPSRAGALLEGSKAFAKEFMLRHQIPTAQYLEVTTHNLESGKAFIDRQPTPIVLKADGLAAGKGVLILDDREEAKGELQAMLQGKFGDAGSKVVIEDFLAGIEFSVFVLTDGSDYLLLPEAKDYKRIGEGDTGLNTGGMGAISPVSFMDETLKEKVIRRIIEPTLAGIRSENIDYQGFIFFGLINVQGDPYVIEYNCRLGDPETEVILPRLKNDLVELFEAMHTRRLKQQSIQVDARYAATVMLVAGGYPGSYPKGDVITGLDHVSASLILHAGTKQTGDQVVTNGGRVIAITSFGTSQQSALEQSYESINRINFQGMYYRRDIGFDLSQDD